MLAIYPELAGTHTMYKKRNTSPYFSQVVPKIHTNISYQTPDYVRTCDSIIEWGPEDFCQLGMIINALFERGNSNPLLLHHRVSPAKLLQ